MLKTAKNALKLCGTVKPEKLLMEETEFAQARRKATHIAQEATKLKAIGDQIQTAQTTCHGKNGNAVAIKV